jgi:aminoglycoside 3-N-acetyltransferase
MSVETTVQALRNDLLALGVHPGGVLLVHSSMKSMGRVEGGAETVICGLLEALGPEGTLLMPALSYERVTPDAPLFDLLNTPSNVGLVPEVFRQRAGTLRSLHPTHSICAVGMMAQELVAEHAKDSTPCGEHSPLHLLPGKNGQILMLGCGLEPNTSMHAVEELVDPLYLYDPPMDYRLILPDGRKSIRRYRPHNFRGWMQRYERLEDLMDGGLVRGRVLKAGCHLLEARLMWETALGKLREDPLYFVDKN